MGKPIRSMMKREVNNGKDTLFWLDDWLGIGPLKTSFPNLFCLERNIRCSITDRISLGGPTWDWKSWPKNDIQIRELIDIASKIGMYQLSNSPDKWSCPLLPDDIYHVDVFRQYLDQLLPLVNSIVINWNHEIPIKILGFVWRANLGRIPSASALIKRGIHVDSSDCCQEIDENANHILIICPFASTMQTWIFRWCRVDMFHFESVGDEINYADT